MNYAARLLVLMSFTPFVFAKDLVQPMVLDKITFQVSSKQWVTTQTALLSVNINITLNNANLVSARSEIMGSLNKIAKGDWHLIQFDRSQDSSGLEKLYVQAQVRIDQSALTEVYQHAKSVSVPGKKYEINGIEFKPGLEEIQAVRAQIRDHLYHEVNEEIARMNKAYPTQNYSVSNLIFVEGGENINQPRAYQVKEMNQVTLASAPAALTVSNELVLTALVEVASNRMPAVANPAAKSQK